MFQRPDMRELIVLSVPVKRIDSMLLIGALMGHDIEHGTHFADNWIYQASTAIENREGLN